MNKYELALVVSAKLEDEARDAVVEKAKSYITRYNGVITEVEEWGKKKLAYEIQKMHEGFYYFIQFEADSQCPAEIERHVRIMDNVLRYLVVRKTHNLLQRIFENTIKKPVHSLRIKRYNDEQSNFNGTLNKRS